MESHLASLAEILFREANYAEAEPLYRELLRSQFTHHSARNEPVVSTTAGLRRLLADWAQAEHADAANHTATVTRAREGERLLRDCLATRTKNLQPTDRQIAETKSRLGERWSPWPSPTPRSTRNHAKFTEAESLLLEGNERLQRSQSTGTEYKRDALTRLVRGWDSAAPNTKAAQADEWRGKLEAMSKETTDKEP